MAEGTRSIDAQSVVVWTAVHHRVAHSLYGLSIWRGLLIERQKSGNATHVKSALSPKRASTG
jgi:hypothetical protein